MFSVWGLSVRVRVMCYGSFQLIVVVELVL